MLQDTKSSQLIAKRTVSDGRGSLVYSKGRNPEKKV